MFGRRKEIKRLRKENKELGKMVDSYSEMLDNSCLENSKLRMAVRHLQEYLRFYSA